jgi:diguanylate cyclase (GGDEF)-like protein
MAFRAWQPGTAEPGTGFAALYDRLAALAGGAGPPLALLVVDLDRFTPVADALQPERTAALLDEVAGRLRRVVRGRDLFAHLGGDRFGVLITGRSQTQGAEEIGRRLLAVVAEPMLLPDGMVVLTAGVAVVVAEPRDDRWSLLAKADLALDLAKVTGPGTLARYRP